MHRVLRVETRVRIVPFIASRAEAQFVLFGPRPGIALAGILAVHIVGTLDGERPDGKGSTPTC